MWINHLRLFLFTFIFGVLWGAGSVAAAAEDVSSAGLMDAGRIRIAQKKPLEAVKYLQRALKEDPKNAEASNLLGVAYLQVHSVDTALSYFRRAARLDPEDSRFYNNTGTAYHFKKDYKAAVKYYKKALEKQADYLLALCNLANAYFAMKKNLQAVDVLHRIVQLDPGYLVRQQESTLLGVGDLDMAERYFYLAKLYIQAGDKDRAILFLQKSLEAGLRNRGRLQRDKDFDPLAGDPRFAELIRKK
ncbi:MAG: tetratricopeptide repeat protein [Acidobacteria bacterium]|nr:tetratricopeptide repeat protein [Acidobacteriota bacterium]